MQGGNNYPLTEYNNERNVIEIPSFESLQINKGSLVNVIKMFRRQDYYSPIHKDTTRFEKC